ncbi:accessory gland-specific peptide 26Ab [Drosophila eugracilis]|uniref:accessory gland-specific peptide 26Ab n=1 Tax=Drosophila eugracilis TaxID=29029 RepID=UPI0007E89562|nr:accessory gland-specific peptide 26Ab [Drosophila eugracilis]
MNYLVLLIIFSFICPWHCSEAAPLISIQSNSRSRSQRTMGGLLRTVYDISVQDNVNDSTGQLVHTRQAAFDSDLMSPAELKQARQQLVVI